MNEPFMLKWIKVCFKNTESYLSTTKYLLIMDQYESNQKGSDLNDLKHFNNLVKCIPVKATHFLQSLDTGVNSDFKTSMKYE